MGRWIAIVLASFTAAFLVLGVEWVESDSPGSLGAARALTAVTTGTFNPRHPAAAFPPNWKSVMGYLPGTEAGPHGTPILIKPTGGCSAPVLGATPYNFDAVCKEHDLAYDVLRYSERIGAPLPASARQAADDMFGRELHARCDQEHLTGLSFATCHLFAESFVEVVRVNSWRQGYRPPGTENGWQWLSVVLLMLALIGLRTAHAVLGRRARRARAIGLEMLPGLGRALRDRLLPPMVGPAMARTMSTAPTTAGALHSIA